MLLWMTLSATVYTVSQDGTGDYTSIQPAIEVSVTGDSVLVEPGRYYENLTVSNGITLASLYLTTGNPDYVHSTVIDGNQTGTCLLIENTLPDTFNLIGFTITNGNGNIYGSRGGGITAHDTELKLTKTIIENNTGEYAGGILIWDSSIYLSATTIRYNRGERGGLEMVDCYNIEFDPVNLCNIYLNYGETCDLRKFSSEIQPAIEIFADTLTVLNPLASDGYFFDSIDLYNTPLQDIIIHANRGKIEPVNSDLYVSPEGDDNNSGLSPQFPLQRLSTAMTRIASDSLQHNTIYLSNGVYSAEANDQHFPLGMRNWVNIEGQSMENTIIECGLEAATFRCRNNSLRLGFKISNLQFIQNSLPDMGGLGPLALGSGQQFPGDSLVVENILIQNCRTNNYLMRFSRIRGYEFGYPYDADFHLRNIYLLNNTASTAISFYQCNVLAENIVIQGHEQIEEGYQINAVPLIYTGQGKFKLINSIITECINHNTDFPNVPAAIGINAYGSGLSNLRADIINCTIGNNHSDSYGGGGVALLDGPMSVNFYNTIIYGNTDHEVIAIDDPNINNDYIDVNFYNTVIDPGEVLTGSEVNLYYNLACNDVNPLWYNTGELPYFLQEDSYCIDTGTLTQLDSLIAFLPETDLAGNPRIYNNQIDMGCYEWNPDVGTNEFKIENVKCKIENYPNPFNPETKITYLLSEESEVEIAVYNIKGQLVKLLHQESEEAGEHFVVWEGMDNQNRSCASGIYFCRISTSSQVKTQKMLLLK